MLEGKMILITGSSRGIGAATARKVIEYGGRAILHGRTESDELNALADELHVPYVVADVTNTEQVNSAVDEAIGYGSVEGLVTAAGMFVGSRGVAESSDADWETMWAVNVMGTVRFVRALAPHLKSHERSSIVMIGSRSGLSHLASASVEYGVSKAAITKLMTSVARELAPTVRVNEIAPGMTQTGMTKDMTLQGHPAGMSLLKRLAQPEEIAEVACFLLSDRASFITGETIVADGGSAIA